MRRLTAAQKLWRTLVFFFEVLFVAIPMDIHRWLTLRRKTVVGQVIVITGGGMGIGRRVAELFALEHRAVVVILDIDMSEAGRTVQQIVSDGGKAFAFKCDVADAESVRRCARQIGLHPEIGDVDIVVCNAAVLHMRHMLDFTDVEIQRSFDVNAVGCMHTIRAFLDPMMMRNRGQIVGVASIAGYYGEVYGAAYCATKFAMRGIMESLQMELHERGLQGVKCTTVFPYFTRTPMILSKNLRPTSTWVPFMSINRCAGEIVDAILKEKITAYIPFYITVMATFAKGFMSKYVLVACRRYMNFRYEAIVDSSPCNGKAHSEYS